jgi:hypothetical protein
MREPPNVTAPQKAIAQKWSIPQEWKTIQPVQLEDQTTREKDKIAVQCTV